MKLLFQARLTKVFLAHMISKIVVSCLYGKYALSPKQSA